MPRSLDDHERIEYLAQIWLERHRLCDELIVDSVEGIPVSAAYLYINGRMRDYPAVYYFDDFLEECGFDFLSQ